MIANYVILLQRDNIFGMDKMKLKYYSRIWIISNGNTYFIMADITDLTHIFQ